MVPQLEILAVSFFCLRALRGTKETMEAAIVVCFYLLGNSVFVDGATRSYLRYLFLLCGFLSIWLRKLRSGTPIGRYLWFFLLLFVSVSLIASLIPSISLLKLLSFFLGAYILVEGFHFSKSSRWHWFRLFNTFFIFWVFASLVFFVTGFGYELNGRGFQGVLAHPQVFGPVMGVVASWFIGIGLSQKQISGAVILTIALAVAYIFMSLARTGLIALVLGGGFAYLLSFARRQNRRFGSRTIKLGFLAIIAMLLVLLSNPRLVTDTIVPYIQKREAQTTDINELFLQSRGRLTLNSLQNFEDNFFFGIGFGVPSEAVSGALPSNVKYLAGIPISASVEKGFLPTAVLEEIGFVGGVATVIMLLLLVRAVRRDHTFPMLWLLLAAIFINIGEAIFFSVGGTGFFMWLIVGLAYNYDFFRPSPMRSAS